MNVRLLQHRRRVIEGTARVPCSLFIALALSACGPSEATPASEATPVVARPEPPPKPVPSTDGCVVDEARVVLSSDGPLEALALTPSAEGASLLAAVDPTTLARVDLTAEGEATSTTRAPFPFARALFAATYSGERLVALGHGPCGDDDAANCLHLRVDDVQRSISLPYPIERVRIASSPALLVVARSHREGPAYADLFRFEGDALTHEAVALQARGVPETLHHEVLAATADGARFAVVSRAGAVEDAAGAAILTTAAGSKNVHALEHSAAVDALAFDPARPDALLALVSYEFHRPHIHRLNARGGELEDPRPLGFREAAGAPFVPEIVARLSAEPGGLYLERSNRGGDQLDGRTLVSSVPRTRAAIAQPDDAILVALAPRDPPYGVLIHRVRCDGH